MPPNNSCDITIITDAFRIATLNLFNYAEPPSAYYDNDSIYSSEQWQQKQEWTARLISEMAPDILGMQEVFSPTALTQLCQQHGLNYFALPHPPKIEDDYLHRHPVVALASRFQITASAQVEANPELAKTLGLTRGFRFSRAPLRSLIQIPGFGSVRIYVVHFKSARPQWEHKKTATTLLAPSLPDATGAEHLLLENNLIRPVLGGWSSVMQRGAEAALLLADIIAEQIKHPLPTVLMGDFNDELSSSAFRSIAELNRAALREYELSAPDQAFAGKGLAMQDLFSLTLDGSEPRPTHYWGASGRRLDHILLSSEFDHNYPLSHAQVNEVRIYDRHLLCNDVALDRQCSDHAAVAAEISVRC